MWHALHGRDREVDELAIRARAMPRGSGQAVVLVGPAGVGKSSLLAEAIEQASQNGLTVLRSRVSEAERTLPYGSIRQLAESLGRVRGQSDEIPSAPDGPAGDVLSAAMRWYWWLADAALRAPLALCIDDLHWVDPASMQVLDLLRTRLADVPILLVAATRELPPTWAADSSLLQMQVRPLDRSAVAAMLTEILGGTTAELTAACMDITHGNPLLVREVARALRAAGHGADAPAQVVHRIVPESVVVSTYARVSSFGPDAVAVAEALALLGDGHDLAPVAELAGLDPAAAAEAVDRLAADGLLQQGRPLAFEHPLLLAAVRDAIPGRRRSDLHLRAMRLFGTEQGNLDRASAHALVVDAAGSAEVLRVLRDGARHAMERAAPHTAVRYLRRAVAEPPSAEDEAEVLVELATAAYAAQEPDALDLAQLAVERARTGQHAVTAALGAGHLLAIAGRGREATELLLPHLEAEGLPPEVKEVVFGAALMCSAMSVGGREPGRALLQQASRLTASPDCPVPILAVEAVELAYASGSAAEVLEMAERAWGDGELLALTGADQPYVHSVAMAAGLAGEPDLVGAWGAAMLTSAAETGSLLGRLVSVLWPAWAREANGDLTASDAYARECIELSARAGIPIASPIPVVVLSRTALVRTGPEAAAKALELIPEVVRTPHHISAPTWWLARAAANTGLGRYADVMIDVNNIRQWQQRWPAPRGGATFWEPFAVEAHLARGDHGEARKIATTGLERARDFGARRPIVHALRALALTSEQDERESLLTEAIGLAGLGGCGADEATLLLDRAAGLEAQEALEDLRTALVVCEQTGADYLGSRAVDAMAELGARPRRAAVTGIHSLTPAERRVVDLAAVGSTNRAIAETLFITEKTAETHLTKAYRKLGIRSRAQLAKILDEGGAGQSA